MIASRVALGVMRMDALDAADAARTVAVAHDSGIDYFDTADIYGFHDHAAHASSKRFGQAWKDAGLDRSTIFGLRVKKCVRNRGFSRIDL